MDAAEGDVEVKVILRCDGVDAGRERNREVGGVCVSAWVRDG